MSINFIAIFQSTIFNYFEVTESNNISNDKSIETNNNDNIIIESPQEDSKRNPESKLEEEKPKNYNHHLPWNKQNEMHIVL